MFMDMYSIDGGVSASDAAAAYEADFATRAAYGVSYLRYWAAGDAERSSASPVHLAQGQRTPSTTGLMGSPPTRSTRSADTARRRDR